MTSTTKSVKPPNRHKELTQHPRRLRRKRIAAGLSAAELGKLTGYSKQHVSGLELGSHSASPECLLALARALGCEITDLMPAEDAA